MEQCANKVEDKNNSQSGVIGRAFAFLKDSAGLISGLLISAGTIFVFVYCFFKINFLPKELELGDGLVFIFLALGFAIIYVLWMGSSCWFFYILINECSWKTIKNRPLMDNVAAFFLT